MTKAKPKLRSAKTEPRAKRKPVMEHKASLKAATKTEGYQPVEKESKPAPAPVVAPEPKPVGPKLDDVTLEECAQIAESYIRRGTTQHTPRDLLAFEIAAALRAKKGAK